MSVDLGTIENRPVKQATTLRVRGGEQDYLEERHELLHGPTHKLLILLGNSHCE